QQIESHVQPGATVALFRAELLAARDKLEEARKEAEAERDRDPKQVEPWLFLVALATRQGQPMLIPALLDDAENRAGKRPEWILARARVSLRRGGEKARKELPGLLRRAEEFRGVEQERLLAGLAAAFAAVGETKTAHRLWSQCADRNPDD